MKDGADIEEERRLFYVGMTRAKDELVLLSSRKRFLYGQRYTQEPSPFLREIPERLIEQRAVPERIRKQKEPDPQMGLF
jgi:DNA helicase-2/ATP-dependent DNA helicase PcrA